MTGVLVLDKGTELADAVTQAVPALAGGVEVVHQTAKAATALAGGRVGVLIAGPAFLTPTGLRFLQQAHERRPGLVTLLVTGRDGADVPLRDIVRAGASDLVRWPASPTVVRAAIERAVELAGAATESAPATGVAYTITSPTGGCGKTFFATNVAYELAVHSGKRVLVVDLDLQFGEVSTALRLRPERTIVDHHASSPGRGGDDPEVLKERLRDMVVRHPTGIDVLAAPHDPAEADLIAGPDVGRVVQAAKELYHYVVVDTPAAITEAVLAAFDLSDGLVVMATLDLPSVKNLGTFMTTLERLHIPDEGVRLVLNKAESDVGLSPAEVQRLFTQGFAGVIPYAKEASRSLNAGVPVLHTSRDSAIGRALGTTIRAVLPNETTFDAAPPQSSAAAATERRPTTASLLSRLRARIA